MIIFLIETICCDPSSEPSEQDGLDKGSQHTFLCRINKYSGFIRVREMSRKLKNFQGQGIVREFHNLSGKIEFLLKCQGDVRET